MDLMLPNMKDISSDFHHDPVESVNPVQPETLTAIYWTLYVLLKRYKDKWLCQLYKIICCSAGWHTCKTSLFQS